MLDSEYLFLYIRSPRMVFNMSSPATSLNKGIFTRKHIAIVLAALWIYLLCPIRHFPFGSRVPFHAIRLQTSQVYNITRPKMCKCKANLLPKLGGGKVGDKRKAFYNPDEAATIFCTCLEVEKVCGLT